RIVRQPEPAACFLTRHRRTKDVVDRVWHSRDALADAKRCQVVLDRIRHHEVAVTGFKKVPAQQGIAGTRLVGNGIVHDDDRFYALPPEISGYGAERGSKKRHPELEQDDVRLEL